jgi:hypothetical protein
MTAAAAELDDDLDRGGIEAAQLDTARMQPITPERTSAWHGCSLRAVIPGTMVTPFELGNRILARPCRFCGSAAERASVSQLPLTGPRPTVRLVSNGRRGRGCAPAAPGPVRSCRRERIEVTATSTCSRGSRYTVRSPGQGELLAAAGELRETYAAVDWSTSLLGSPEAESRSCPRR